MKRVLYVLTAATQGFMRNPTMSLASTFTVALMLTLFAFFLTTDRGLQAAVAVLEGKVEVAAFVDDNAKVSDVLALKARIEANPAVARVDYVTKDQALERLRAIAANRPDLALTDLSSNPLPASLEIKLADARQASTLAHDLRAEIGKGVVYDAAVILSGTFSFRASPPWATRVVGPGCLVMMEKRSGLSVLKIVSCMGLLENICCQN